MRVTPAVLGLKGFRPGARVEMTDGPICGCVGRVLRPVGVVGIFGGIHNCVEVLVCRRRFTYPEAFLRKTNKETGCTI